MTESDCHPMPPDRGSTTSRAGRTAVVGGWSSQQVPPAARCSTGRSRSGRRAEPAPGPLPLSASVRLAHGRGMTSHLDSPARPDRALASTGLAGAPVIVGFDESAASVAALQWAAAEAARLGSELTVLSASDPPVPTPVSVGVGVSRPGPDLRSSSRAAAGRGVDLARACNADGVIAAVGVVGGPAGELVARSSDAGLVVVGRNRRSGLQAPVLGSVSFAVALHARCPVAVVGEGAERHPSTSWPVVVGTDGSRPALAA